MEVISEKKSIASVVGTISNNGVCGNNGICQINVDK